MPKTFYKLTDRRNYNLHAKIFSAYYEPGKVVTCPNKRGLKVWSNIDDLFDYRNGKSVFQIKLWEVSVKEDDIVGDVIGSGGVVTRVKRFEVVSELHESEAYGPNHSEVFRFLRRLESLPFRTPRPLNLVWVERLVREHLEELSTYAEPGAFSGVTVRFVYTRKEYEAVFDAVRLSNYRNDGSISSRYNKALKASREYIKKFSALAVSSAAHEILAAYPAECSVAAQLAAADIVSNTKGRPWKPIVEIYEKGGTPITGLVGNDFVVYVA